MHEPLISMSRRTRRTPFSSRIEAQGVGGFTVYNHMLLPTFFRGLEEDYHHLKQHVQVWDVTCEQQVEVLGPGRGPPRATDDATRHLPPGAGPVCLRAPGGRDGRHDQ